MGIGVSVIGWFSEGYGCFMGYVKNEGKLP